MATDRPLTIAYAGSLNAYQPKPGGEPWWQGIRDYLWTYKVKNLRPYTRSGYYLIQALKILKEEHQITSSELQVDLWGLIEAGNIAQAKAAGIEDLLLIGGYMNKEESLRKMQESDVLFLPLESGKDGQRPLFIPGKLFEYLNMRKPILALCDESDCKEIIGKSGLGQFARADQPQEIAESILDMIKKRSELTTLYAPDHEYIDQFNFENRARNLAEILDEIRND